MNKIPLWVIIGSVVLAFSAGMMNVTALMGFTHVSVSHVTGNVSMMARTALLGDWHGFSLFLMSIAAFWGGSVLSGAIIGTTRLTKGKNYGLAMLCEFVLILLSLVLFIKGSAWGQMLLAMACGLQNSMVTTYDGIVVRTTHLTGVTSDLGAMVGSWLVGKPMNMKRVIVQSSIWWGFLAGGLVAVLSFIKIGYYTLLLPAMVILCSALLYEKFSKTVMRTERLLKVYLAKKRRNSKL